jgi:hypothetical protein
MIMLRLFLWTSIPANDILDAAYSADEESISRLFDWERERVATLTKATAGVATTIIITFLAALLRPETSLGGEAYVPLLLAVIVLYGWAAILQVSLQRVGGMYAATVAGFGRP